MIGKRKEVVVVATGRMVHHILDSNVPALKVRGLSRHEMMLKRSDPLHFQLKGPGAGCLLVPFKSVLLHGCSLRT